jgi:uncharacterized protein (DUF849 family)
MPLAMNREVFITCAVTGSGGTQDRSPHVPRSPQQIAESAIDAAKAGAAIVHCHVRDPETGKPSRDPALYREVTERIRDSAVDCVLNLTAGMGGDITFGSVEAPLPVNPAGTDMAGAAERVAHVVQCRPELCTLDCGTMNFAEADYVMTNTPGMLRAMGGNVRVGLEDSLFISRGKLAESNAQQVAKARALIEALGKRVATPDEARAMLDLKGGDRVNF